MKSEKDIYIYTLNDTSCVIYLLSDPTLTALCVLGLVQLEPPFWWMGIRVADGSCSFLNIHAPRKSTFSKKNWLTNVFLLSISFAFLHPLQSLAFCGSALQCFALIEQPVNPRSQGFPQNIPLIHLVNESANMAWLQIHRSEIFS